MMKKILFRYYPILINIYLIWMLYKMFFDYNRGDETLIYEIHYLPFESILQLLQSDIPLYFTLKNIFGNIILFMPYGFLGILYPQLNQYKYLFLAFFLGINYLEFSQYFFHRGFAEFDDVILNSMGMTLGFLLYKKFFKKPAHGN